MMSACHLQLRCTSAHGSTNAHKGQSQALLQEPSPAAFGEVLQAFSATPDRKGLGIKKRQNEVLQKQQKGSRNTEIRIQNKNEILGARRFKAED